ncbi:MAG: hypothetical protein ACREWG_06785 [Gammaproteobacteria bacterium]
MATTSTGRRYAYLLLLVPPLLMTNLSAILFESSVDPAASIAETVRAQIEATPPLSPSEGFKEARARYTWLAAALLAIAVPIIASVVSIKTILRSEIAGRDLRVIIATGAVLIAGSASYTFGAKGLQEMIYGYTYETLSASARFSGEFLGDIAVILVAINMVAAVVPIIMLLGVCSTAILLPTGSGDHPRYWEQQMGHLKEIMHASSAYLVFGILHMDAWLQWPAALTRDAELRQTLLDLAHAITLYWGVSFTLLVIASYWPVAYFLNRQARDVLTRHQGTLGIDDPDRWLREHNLSINMAHQLPQLFAMLAPFFSSPLISILSSITSF